MMKLEERQTILIANDNNEYILVKKADLEKLIEETIGDSPKWAVGLKWLENKTGLSRSSLPGKLLYPFRKELEHCVDYPDVNGERWRFHIKGMNDWLDKQESFKKVNK